MRIISIKKIKDFWEAGHAEAEQSLKVWYHLFKQKEFQNSSSIKELFPSASIIGNNRVVLIYLVINTC